jgi:reactive chlorine resistance protein C
MTESKLEKQPAILALFGPNRTRRLTGVGLAVLRYGLVALLVLWGGFKFTAFEAEGIRPLVEHSPLLKWLYPLLGVRGTSSLIGVVELVAAALICTRRWRPALSALGSLLAAATFVVTLSFLVTTPNVFAPTNPFGGFLMKDIMLLGAALYTAGEALEAAASRWRARS